MRKILIWGTGNIEQQMNVDEINGDVIGYVETKKTKDCYKGKKVYAIEELPVSYDYIIVANTYTDEIYDICKIHNIDMEKIIFMSYSKQSRGISDDELIKEILGKRNYPIYAWGMGKYSGTFFDEDMALYNKLNTRESFKIDSSCLWPIIGDKYRNAGVINNYFWQDLWAARLIYKSGVRSHFDIGSRIDGFIAHLLAMGIDVTLIDIREFPAEIEGLHTIVDDATMLGQVKDESIQSMSALCSLEHFGLGRYGDPVDPEACFRCFNEIQKKIVKGGNFYLSLPIGRERVEFNAHRVFYPSTVVESFQDMELKEFSCTAAGEIENFVDIHKYDNDCHNGDYRYGLFHFIKK